ncbi:hypothetical protein, partial [Enterobacter hormaechei]
GACRHRTELQGSFIVPTWPGGQRRIEAEGTDILFAVDVHRLPGRYPGSFPYAASVSCKA